MSRKKTQKQVAFIQETQRTTEVAMQAVIDYLQLTATPTSEEAHAIIDRVLTEHGCDSPERYVVAGGKQSSEPHEIGSGVLKDHEPIVIDIFPRSKFTGYFADMSRTVCIGAPPARLKKMYNTVLDAQELAIAMVAPGVVCSDIQNAVEKLFIKRGFETSGKGKEFAYAEGFVHGIGHGVGTTIHEEPRIGTDTMGILEEGDVITIEPGLYYKDIGGVRLEDMLLVTSNGYKNLTNFPKKLQV
jgi:Xaa-Pro aminopeptidase